jgi:O-antigen ligase
MTAALAPALAALLFLSLLMAWVPARWAVSLLETGAFSLAALWVVQWILRGGRPRAGWPLIPLAAAPLWGLAQLAAGHSVYRHATWNAVLGWMANLALFFLALQVFADAGVRRRFLGATAWFALAVSVVATLQLFTSEGRVFWIFPVSVESPVAGPFLSRNQFAAFIELTLPLALAGAARGGRHALAGLLMAGAMYASVIASGSRAGFVLVSLEVAVFAVLAFRRRARTLAWLLASVILFTTLVGWERLWSRLRQPDPYRDRRQMLAASIDMARERPWAGFGLGTWPYVYPAYARSDDGLVANHAHNDWAEWAAEGGLPFLALLLSIALWSLRPALGSGWGIGLVAVAAHALVDYPFQKPALAALFFVLLAVLALEYKQITKKT